ncbi:ASCH domain-containing protein [Knoellia sp. CPCC 206453]|uniref:ASCH domain-containing protein n=1 Tax=Knoellia pratensis TaxID=3404796 RepID=UPI00361B839F
MTDSQTPRPDDETAHETADNTFAEGVDTGVDEAAEEQVRAFWDVARLHAHLSEVPAYFGPTPLDSVPPPAWSFGAGPEQADELLGLVLAGTKTATAGALWDYEAEEEALPEIGTLSIILDSNGQPRALIETTEVQVVPFDEITDEQARLEGEGDLSLAYWREVHQRFFTEVADHDRGFSTDMPVVWERFRVLYSD